MTSTRIIRVWNKTVTITNVPDGITNEQLTEWTKKRLIIDGYRKQGQIAK